jgi:hypothetical protein
VSWHFESEYRVGDNIFKHGVKGYKQEHPLVVGVLFDEFGKVAYLVQWSNKNRSFIATDERCEAQP